MKKNEPRAWEIHKASIPYGGVRRNELFFTRLNTSERHHDDCDFMRDYDEIVKKKLYEVSNVEDELEQLTDDEDEIDRKSKYMPHARAIYEVKK